MGICSRRGVVLIRDDNGFRAGRFEANYELHDTSLTLARPLTLVRRDQHDSAAVWEGIEGPSETLETKDIVASVEYVECSNGNVATILPLELR